MRRQAARYSRLADILLRQNKLSREQLDNVLREMNLAGETLIFQLVKQNIFTSEEITEFISRSFGRPIVDLDQIEIPQNLTAISTDIMRRNKALPIKRAGNMLTLAVADPYDISALDEMAFISGCQIELVIVSEDQLLRHLDSLGTADGHLDDVMADLGASDMEVVDTSEAHLDEHTLTAETEAAPVVKLVNLVLLDAIKRGASDIHLEPYEKVVRVRYRIDGVLHEIMRPPIRMRDAMVSRLKILARLDISERRMPQDGRIKLRLSKTKTVDFRVSVLPTLFGEKVVMRLLDPSSLQLDMTKLGYEEQSLKRLKDAIHQPYGMVLVTGPTGSGKTVSLYSAVAELNQPGVNICTAEDPVEFNFMGINQVNVNADIGLDFPAALRSFLRQDPDIILIGEIRDHDTAAIGIKAALTGHLVLATLHTNDAPSTMTRLVNMGIESFLVGSAVNLVSAQRLARRICKECAEPVEIPAEALIDAGVPESEVADFKAMHGKGCQVCNGTGYKGRTGIYQVMPIFDDIRDAVYAGKNSNEINDIAVSHGIKTLRMAALDKVRAGELSLEECLRVTVAD
ncbi:MAG: type IV-A pilus assembly ATPase PilB [Zetaproteobacteria bacterium CG12_big_fil_rev_8_21_14_0_65_55_1124]|nr:MAG: type IV-A pilus assembly ATPase PilB [Zetaproteobacteria bacterium CG1_02_55_237]PIS18841.1 MAG: type IV-A pilus assembly ATPase PilB [Zetaproteobacteria bacterium CG08_land_8_20_14_0_20_55_17]PIW42759.1 MAG: type IV-A pilus assembly ATPase PilB [Zetaproteobacteria bacterium CG12_big_fil_rev_8_21_14_0_65_55_1124]PIY51786.1 MAG: type IV-A pilus assembly ATPase PilB [Zetaproteobacteria bacterium CG_4_10_14_0_8_um_filter_55_43]PIZ40038.1 MAG: type IV-A pilus assembly ATPase PilB [Zetaprote